MPVPRRAATSRAAESASAPVGTLRGATVADVEARLLARVAVGIAVAVLVVAAVTLFIAGARKNAQISALRTHGVRVTVTVSACQGLLGGSGSNPAGYACRGTYRVNGHPHAAAIPGDVLRRPGSAVRAIVTPEDPGLISTVRVLATEQPSGRVYVLPCVLALGALAMGTGVLSARRRRARAPGPAAPPGRPGFSGAA